MNKIRVTREEVNAEQAVKDAVEIANDVLGQLSRLELWDKAQAIIDKYEVKP